MSYDFINSCYEPPNGIKGRFELGITTQPKCAAAPQRGSLMSLFAILTLGFFLGMRHATDADHVVAVSTIVSRKRSLRAAAPIGILWGLGHTLTILVVGGAIIVFGVVIPPRLGLSMELSVAFMLVLLGALNVRGVVHEARAIAHAHAHEGATREHPHASDTSEMRGSFRPLFVGIVHGLAGSAAVALLVLGTIRNPVWGLAYLLIFGVGTIAGMLLITTAFAVPVVASARRFERLHTVLAVTTGIASVLFGMLLVYEIGFVHGLFTSHPQWTPQ
jgi:sulfite exporter TauE/SafE